MTLIADFAGPLAEGMILLGIVPAATLVVGMVATSRLVEWKTARVLASAPNPDRQLPRSEP